jgi:hypothetical protein
MGMRAQERIPTLGNFGTDEGRLLCMFAPGGFERRFERMLAKQHGDAVLAERSEAERATRLLRRRSASHWRRVCSSAERTTTRPAAQAVLALSVRDAESIRQDWVSIVMGNSSPCVQIKFPVGCSEVEWRHG